MGKPLNLAEKTNVDKLRNSIDIAKGAKVTVEGGFVLTVGEEIVDISGVMSYFGIDVSKDFTVNGMKYSKNKEAWQEAMEESGVNPFSDGFSTLGQLVMEQDLMTIGTGGTFGSWQTLNYYKDNAAHNGYFELSDTMEQFKSLRKDWGAMVSAMISDYMNGGLFKQAMPRLIREGRYGSERQKG